MKITSAEEYFNKKEYRSVPVFIIEGALLPNIPQDISSAVYDQKGNRGAEYVHLRHIVELNSAYRDWLSLKFTKVVDEINPQIKDMIPWNTWGSRTDYVKLTNKFQVLIDYPGFYMKPHIDNRNVGSVISLNLKDNPEGTGTRFYNISEITMDNIKRRTSDELKAARRSYEDHCFMFEGPNKKGTGVLWWNHHNTFHGVRNDSQDTRHTLYSITSVPEYMDDLKLEVELDVVDRYNLKKSKET